MSKRKAGGKGKKRHATPRRSRSRLAKLWRKHARTVKRVAYIGGPLIVVAVAAYFVIGSLTASSRAGRANEYVTQAREDFLRSKYNDAQVAYHQALNADPDDAALKREQTMFQLRASLSSAASLRNAIAAANAVVSYDSSSAIGYIVLAQLYNKRGDLESLRDYAKRALDLAEEQENQCEKIAASVLLCSYYRQTDVYDTALQYGSIAALAAAETQDTFDLLLANSGYAYSALGLDSLDQAETLLRRTIELAGTTYPGFIELANTGLAEYFERAEQPDSALYYARLVLADTTQQSLNPNSAHAERIAGESLAKLGSLDDATQLLENAATTWRKLSGYSDLITTYNSLGDVYLEKKDYYDSRKYYLAATQLAGKYGLEKKGKYDVNLNNYFLDKLTSDGYLRSGKEAEDLVKQVLTEMGYSS